MAFTDFSDKSENAAYQAEVDCGLQATRWRPGRALVVVADRGYAAIELLARCQRLAETPIVNVFVRRWAMEATFQQARAHLGVAGQRQWNDLAVARSRPAPAAGITFSITVLPTDSNEIMAICLSPSGDTTGSSSEQVASLLSKRPLNPPRIVGWQTGQFPNVQRKKSAWLT